MRRTYKILLVLFIVFFVCLTLYAFVKPVKSWMQDTWGPPAMGIFGRIHEAVITNPIWKNYIIPFPNQMIWGVLLLGLPMFWLFLKVRTQVRKVVIRGAAKETGMYPAEVEPLSSRPTVAQPMPTRTNPPEELKPPPTQTVETPPAPPPEEEV